MGRMELSEWGLLLAKVSFSGRFLLHFALDLLLTFLVSLCRLLFPSLFASEPWWATLCFQIFEAQISDPSTTISSTTQALRSTSIRLAQALISSKEVDSSSSSPTPSTDSGIIVDHLSLFLSPDDLLDDGNVLFQSSKSGESGEMEVKEQVMRDKLTKLELKRSVMGGTRLRTCLKCGSKSNMGEQKMMGWNWLESEGKCSCGGSWWVF